MRMMLKVSMPVEAGSRAVKDGTLASTMKSVLEKIRAEAAYFTTENGKRTAFIVFDMTDSSQMPVIAEPFFMRLNADITWAPCMNVDEVMRGIEAAKPAF